MSGYRQLRPLARVLIVSVALAAGCATPANRIRRNPELFNSFPPEVQEKVRQGEVDIGFKPEMVVMALGRPDRVYRRKAKDAELQVWSYTRTLWSRDVIPSSYRYWYRDAGGRARPGYDTGWTEVETREEYEWLRLELGADGVSAMDVLSR
jgi:hypothetical protein